MRGISVFHLIMCSEEAKKWILILINKWKNNIPKDGMLYKLYDLHVTQTLHII